MIAPLPIWKIVRRSVDIDPDLIIAFVQEVGLDIQKQLLG
jgi:hypothetical protein